MDKTEGRAARLSVSPQKALASLRQSEGLLAFLGVGSVQWPRTWILGPWDERLGGSRALV